MLIIGSSRSIGRFFAGEEDLPAEGQFAAKCPCFPQRRHISAALARFFPVGPFEKPLDEVPLPLDLFLDFPPLEGPLGF